MPWTKRAQWYVAGVAAATVLAGTTIGSAVFAASRVVHANPQTFQNALLAAHGGETVVLAPGDYGDVTIGQRQFPRRVTIDASQAHFVRLIIRRVDGLTVAGGTVTAPREMQHSVVIDFSHDVTVTGMHISGARIGTLISRSQGIEVSNNDYNGTRSDGVNIAMSQHVRVTGNTCRNFNPMIGSFDARGKVVKDGDHPDCVQAWSVPNTPPTSDVLVANNSADGFMQGVFFGNPGSGGYDRIVIRDNRIRISAWNAIVIYEGRGVTVTGNEVSTIPGAKWIAYPFRPVVAHIKLINSANVQACGNKVEQPRDSDGTRKC